MSTGESIVQSLLSGIEFGDSRLYSVLQQIASDLYRVDKQLNPPTVAGAFGLTGQLILPSFVSGFSATLTSDNLKLQWSPINGLVSYEIRYKIGSNVSTDWDTAAVILRTSTFSADINPLLVPLVYGNHTFFIKAIDPAGNYSIIASFAVVNIPIIPTTVVTTVVINNFVLLYWTTPLSVFAIDHYNIYKDGVLQGSISGTFKTVFEIIGGTFTYIIQAVDIVGNLGIPSTGAVVIVTNPADFSLRSSITSTLTGTKTNCVKEVIGGGNYLLACVNATETYQAHFTGNAWTTPQNQITAGFPLYVEPAFTTGQYQEVFDFGSIINNIIVVMNWSTIIVNGSVTTATSTIETSTDNIIWTTPIISSSAYATAVRYVRFTMKFIGSSNTSLCYFYNIRCLLNVHQESDGGQITLNAGDVGGTVVTFTKAFKTVQAINLTSQSLQPIDLIYDFSFPVNPTTFKAFAFDNTGNRITATISWSARGIL